MCHLLRLPNEQRGLKHSDATRPHFRPTELTLSVEGAANALQGRFSHPASWGKAQGMRPLRHNRIFIHSKPRRGAGVLPNFLPESSNFSRGCCPADSTQMYLLAQTARSVRAGVNCKLIELKVHLKKKNKSRSYKFFSWVEKMLCAYSVSAIQVLCKCL